MSDRFKRFHSDDFLVTNPALRIAFEPFEWRERSKRRWNRSIWFGHSIYGGACLARLEPLEGTHMRMLSRVAIAVLAATFLSAAPLDTSTAMALPKDEHCAIEVGSIAAPASSAEPICFNTEVEVQEHLNQIMHASRAASSVILGTVYKDAGYSGASLTYWGSSGCAGVTFGYPSLQADWRYSISSARASGSCWMTLYTGTSYSGSKLNCAPGCTGIGTLNDNVGSIVFRPAGLWG